MREKSNERMAAKIVYTGDRRLYNRGRDIIGTRNYQTLKPRKKSDELPARSTPKTADDGYHKVSGTEPIYERVNVESRASTVSSRSEVILLTAESSRAVPNSVASSRTWIRADWEAELKVTAIFMVLEVGRVM